MVYGVFREQYSGRNVEGYFLNGEDAYKYCAYKNKEIGDDNYYYAMGIDEIKADFDKTETLYYSYYIRTNQDNLFAYDIKCVFIPEKRFVSEERCFYTFCFKSCFYNVCFTSPKFLEEDQIKKIAYDMIDEYKAQKK